MDTKLLVAIIADILDFVLFPLFQLPVIGDIIDLIVAYYIYRQSGGDPKAAIALGELIPGLDSIPFATIAALASRSEVD